MGKNDNGIPAQVVEVRPNDIYLLQLDDGKEILGYRAGRMKVHKVSIVVGDKVRVVLDPYGGKATNRIVYRV